MDNVPSEPKPKLEPIRHAAAAAAAAQLQLEAFAMTQAHNHTSAITQGRLGISALPIALPLALTLALALHLEMAAAQTQIPPATAEMAVVPKMSLGSVKDARAQIAEDRERILNVPVQDHNYGDYAYNMLRGMHEKAKASNAALTRRAFVLSFSDKAKAGDVDAGYFLAAAKLSKFGISGSSDAELEKGIGAAMRKGKPEAERDYAVLLGDGIGVEKSPEKALALAKKAASSGLASAQSLLGDFYGAGVGAPENAVAAAAAWKKAADGGDIPGAFRYGQAATGGYGMKADPSAGILSVKRAADAGDDRAMYFYGMSTETGLYGLTKDINAGTAYVQKAADAGNPLAQNIMGLKYARGMGVGRDAEYANMYLEAAARNGLADGQVNFGVRMIKGEGMAVNRAEGVAWIKKAAAQENEEAIELLEQLEPQGKK